MHMSSQTFFPAFFHYANWSGLISDQEEMEGRFFFWIVTMVCRDFYVYVEGGTRNCKHFFVLREILCL